MWCGLAPSIDLFVSLGIIYVHMEPSCVEREREGGRTVACAYTQTAHTNSPHTTHHTTPQAMSKIASDVSKAQEAAAAEARCVRACMRSVGWMTAAWIRLPHLTPQHTTDTRSNDLIAQ